MEYHPVVDASGIRAIAEKQGRAPQDRAATSRENLDGAVCAVRCGVDYSGDIDALTERAIGCAIAVHREFGPGLLESIYRDSLVIELKAQGVHVERERHVTLTYRSQPVGNDLRLDILVEGCLVIEVKAVERLHPIHLAQVITYLKLTGCPVGLLMNFNTTSLRAGLRRLVHPDKYVPRVTRRPGVADPKVE